MVLTYSPGFTEDSGFAIEDNEQIVAVDPTTGETSSIGRLPSQEAYEQLCTRLVVHVYDMLENELGLERLSLNGVPIWATPGAHDDSSRPLLVIMQGMSPVRPGIWSRAVCINEGLTPGTVRPLVLAAHNVGYNVLIANPNQTSREDKLLEAFAPLPQSNPMRDQRGVLFGGQPVPLKDQISTNETPKRHAATLWQRYLRDCAAPRIDVLAFSFGGVATLELLANVFAEDAGERFKRVAFLDSVHNFRGGNPQIGAFLMSSNARCWVASETPDLQLAAGDNAQLVCAVRGSGASQHDLVPDAAALTALDWICETLDTSLYN